MSDIKLIWDNATASADVALDGADIAMDDTFETACIVSFFTDRKADADADLPDGSGDRRGWWGDAFSYVDGDEDGSQEWLLDRAKIETETLLAFGDYSKAALDWMKKDGVAAAVDIAIARLDTNLVGRQVIITKPDGTVSQYDYVWKAI